MNPQLASEEKTLNLIVSDIQALANAIGFALDTAFPFPEHTYGQSVFIGINVPRNFLGLDPSEKPGDIDLLIIPAKGHNLWLSKIIAIEAKIIRPTIKKPSKNANSRGVKQAMGLLRDGFPYVGLLHISIPESLPSYFHQRIPLMENKFDNDGSLIKTGKYIPIDTFPTIQAERQEGRLIAMNLPETVAYNSIAFNSCSLPDQFSGNSIGNSRQGKVNDKISSELIYNIEALARKRPETFHKIDWYKGSLKN